MNELHSVAAEREVIGAVLLDNSALDRIALQPDHFFTRANATIYAAILQIRAEGTPADFVTVTEALKRGGEFDAVGGYDYIAGITSGTLTSAAVEHHAKIVREKAQLRGIITTAQELIDKARDGEYDAGELAEQGIRTLGDMITTGAANNSRCISDVAADAYAYIEQVAGGNIKQMHTGIQTLDALTGGIHPGELTIMGGRPGTGKSALAMHFADKLARNGHRVLFISREMSHQQYGLRALSRSSGVSSGVMRSGKLSDGQWAAVAEGVAELMGSRVPIYINTTAARPSEIAQAAREMRHRTGLDLIIVDYLQLLRPDGKHGNREQEVAAMSRALKALTADGYAVMALSQLSRGARDKDGTERKDKAPQLSDLRESGAIEQDADNVLLLWEPSLQPAPVAGVRHVMLKVAKQRQGETGTIKLAFRPSRMMYTAITEEK